MGEFDNELGKWLLYVLIPSIIGFIVKLWTKLNGSIDSHNTKLHSLETKIAAIEANKITYEQSMSMLDKQEERIMNRLINIDNKLDRVIERFGNN